MRKKKFWSVDERQNSIPEPLQDTVSELRNVIPWMDQHIVEQLKYNLCFFTYHNQLLAYVNLEWINKSKNKLTLWICQWSKLLEQFSHYEWVLQWDGSMVKKLYFTPDSIIHKDLIQQVVMDSMDIINTNTN